MIARHAVLFSFEFEPHLACVFVAIFKAHVRKTALAAATLASQPARATQSLTIAVVVVAVVVITHPAIGAV